MYDTNMKSYMSSNWLFQACMHENCTKVLSHSLLRIHMSSDGSFRKISTSDALLKFIFSGCNAFNYFSLYSPGNNIISSRVHLKYWHSHIFCNGCLTCQKIKILDLWRRTVQTQIPQKVSGIMFVLWTQLYNSTLGKVLLSLTADWQMKWSYRIA